MTELTINILQPPARSTVRKALGGLYLLIGVTWLIIRIINKEPEQGKLSIPYLDIIYTVFFGFAGIIFIINGFGISISKRIGEAYIKINMTGIYIKKSIFSKEWVLLWNETEQVEYSVFGLKFRLTDNSYRELSYSNLDYGHIQEIKKTIPAIAVGKNIGVIKPDQE